MITGQATTLSKEQSKGNLLASLVDQRVTVQRGTFTIYGELKKGNAWDYEVRLHVYNEYHNKYECVGYAIVCFDVKYVDGIKYTDRGTPWIYLNYNV